MTTADEKLYTLIAQTTEFENYLKTTSNIDEILLQLHRHNDESVSLLIFAVLQEKEDIVRLILSYSNDKQQLVELPGIVHRLNGPLVRNATALWCACDRRYYSIARLLIDIGGAKIEHGPRYPLIIDAIVLDRLDTVRFLIENHYANINTTDMNENYRLNSLIMAVIYGRTSIVAYLLAQGSKLNYTTPSTSNSPLGYAAIKGHLDIVRLLCSSGACLSLTNKHGQTPLMLAAKHDRMSVVDYLLERISVEVAVQQLEFVACSLVMTVQFQRMYKLFYKILEIRLQNNLKKIIAQPIAAYAFQQECQTIDELIQIEHNHDRLYLEALIIRERLLVSEKNESLFKPLLLHGDRLVERGQYELCLHLWEHTFYLYQNMDLETGLHRFVWIFCKMLRNNIPIVPQRFVQIARLTFEPSQQKPRNDYIKNSVCFLALAMKILEQTTITQPERQLIFQWIRDLCRQQRTTSHGQTFLHLIVDRQTFNDINYRSYDIKPIIIFPNLSLTRFLLRNYSNFFDINATDIRTGNTALHISCQSESFSITEYLIQSGAHIDVLNIQNQTPFDLTQTKSIRDLIRSKYAIPNLKCQCARLIVRMKMPYELIWPHGTEMNRFLFLHGSST